MATFQFYLHSGKQKSRVGGGWQSFCFCSKIPWWKRKCETVRCRDATASSFIPKVRGKVFAHFHAVDAKCNRSMQNWRFGRQDEFFVNNPLDVKENDEHALDFVLHLSHRFRSVLNWAWYSDTRMASCAFFPGRLPNHWPGSPSLFFWDLHRIWWMLLLCQIHFRITSGRIQASK
jgi:hypothetical protein